MHPVNADSLTTAAIIAAIAIVGAVIAYRRASRPRADLAPLSAFSPDPADEWSSPCEPCHGTGSTWGRECRTCRGTGRRW